MIEMSDKHFSRTDESFNPAAPERYDLTLQVADLEASYSLLEAGRDKFIAIGTFHMPFDEVMAGNSWLGGVWHSVQVIIENNSSTLVPSLFFDAGEKEKYLSFITEQEASDRVCFESLASPDLVSVFSLAGSLWEKINRYFPGAQIRHNSTAVIRSVWGMYKNLIHGTKVFINIRYENFDLLVFRENQLAYFNSFNFRVPEDLAYYVIFVFEQLALNPEETPVVLIGKAAKESPVFELLFRYIRNIEMGTRNDEFSYSYVFRDIPAQSYYTLLNPGS